MSADIIIKALVALLPLSPATSDEIETHLEAEHMTTNIYADYEGPTMEEEIESVDTPYPIIKNVDAFNVEVGDEFDETEGVYAVDSNDGDVTDSITITDGSVDTSTPGTYYLTYRAEASNGGWYNITRTVTVSDQPTDEYPMIPPTEAQLRGEDPSDDSGGEEGDGELLSQDATGNIEFVGVNDQTISIGQEFDLFEGVEVYDADGNQIPNNLVYTTGTVNNEEPGDYTIGYSVFDEDGEVAAMARVITVQ